MQTKTANVKIISNIFAFGTGKLLLLAILLILSTSVIKAQQGSWTPLFNLPINPVSGVTHSSNEAISLLSDGSVIVESYGVDGIAYPQATGNPLVCNLTTPPPIVTHTGTEREKYFGETVRGTRQYDTLSHEFLLKDSIYVFHKFSEDTTWMHINTDDRIYIDFYNFCKNENIGKFEKVEKLIKDTSNTSTQAASDTNSIIISQRQIELNKKIVNSIYLNKLRYEKVNIGKQYIYASYDSVLLFDVAIQNPLLGGNAVYQARTMMFIEVYDDGYHSTRSHLINYNSTVIPPVFDLYPNPNNGNFILKYHISEKEDAQLCIYDITGRLLKKYELKTDETQINVNAYELEAGTYLYSIMVNSALKEANKIVIIK